MEAEEEHRGAWKVRRSSLSGLVGKYDSLLNRFYYYRHERTERGREVLKYASN
jgi:hypothetical protein